LLISNDKTEFVVQVTRS